MNRFFLFIFVILFTNASPLTAQFNQGDIYLEGNFNFSNGTSDQVINTGFGFRKVETSNSSVSIIPTANFFINDQISLFVGLGYNRSKFEQIRFNGSDFETPKVITESFITIVGARIYHSVSDNIHFYTSFRSYSGFGETKPDENSSEEKSTNFDQSLSIGHGLVFAISDNFLLSASIGTLFISYSKRDFKDFDFKTERLSYGINTNLNSISLSLSYKL